MISTLSLLIHGHQFPEIVNILGSGTRLADHSTNAPLIPLATAERKPALQHLNGPREMLECSPRINKDIKLTPHSRSHPTVQHLGPRSRSISLDLPTSPSQLNSPWIYLKLHFFIPAFLNLYSYLNLPARSRRNRIPTYYSDLRIDK